MHRLSLTGTPIEGPSFFDIANTMPGRVTIGVPRRLNDLAGSTAAIRSARSKIDNPLQFELGNEPDRASYLTVIAFLIFDEILLIL
jgi:hypothetical protein